MLTPELDPYLRVQNRIKDLTRYAQNPFGAQHMSRSLGKEQVEFPEEDRQGFMGKIKENALGSLAKFGNVLDVPGSSMREVASTLTGGGWHNPFDQWLPWNWTKSTGRVSGRDLGRQWGLMGKQDTWGNLFGGIGLEMALDPTIPLTFGLSGAGTKLSRFLKGAGIMEPGAIEAVRMAGGGLEGASDAARYAAKAPLMGKREMLRTPLQDPIEQFVRASVLPGEASESMYKELLGRVEDYAKTQGWESLEQAKQELAGLPLQGVARWGLPQWKMFGAGGKSRKLADAPGFLLGTGEGAQKWGRFWDKALGATKAGTKATPLSYTKGLLDPSVEQTTTPWVQKYMQIGHHLRRMSKEAVGNRNAMRLVAIKEMVDKSLLTEGKSTDEVLKIHDAWRELGEGYSKALDPGQAQIMDEVMQTLFSAHAVAREQGALTDELQDMFTQYFPRQLTQMLRRGEDIMGPLRALDFPMSGAPLQSHTVHDVARELGLGDIAGGTAALNKVFRDKDVYDAGQELMKAGQYEDGIQAIAQKIQELYGPSGTKGQYFKWGPHGELQRTRELTRPKGESRLALDKINEAEDAAKVAEIQKKIDDIKQIDGLSDIDKRAAIEKLQEEHKVRFENDWDVNGLTAEMRMWDYQPVRYKQLAERIAKSSDKTRQYGLFANHPIVDAENYFFRTMDKAAKSHTVTSILSDPRAYEEAANSPYTLGMILERLAMDPNKAIERVAKAFNQTTDTPLRMKALADQAINPAIAQNLLNYHSIIEGPEATTWLGRVLDSTMGAFKANVTSPFPAFHMRNYLSALLRSVLDGTFSHEGVRDSWRMMHGKDIVGAEAIDLVKNTHRDIRKLYPDFPEHLDNRLANEILRHMAGAMGFVGSYGPAGALHSMNKAEQGEAGAELSQGGSGSLEYEMNKAPGNVPFSWSNMLRTYFGRGRKMQDGTELQTTRLGGPLLPMVTVDAPFWAIGKAVGPTARKRNWKGMPGFRPQMWGQQGFFRTPTLMKTRNVYKDFSLTGSTTKYGDNLGDELLFGPTEGGQELGHFVEGVNRLHPWLTQIRQGIDPNAAARNVKAAQISYAPEDYTPFEQQVLKRAVPFYSFSSRTIPWSLEKFLHKPGNMLSQVIHSTKRLGEHLKDQYQGEGPIPAHIGETLAWPMKGREPGVQRFLTGFDLMEQDLWQLGAPLLSGDLPLLSYELAGRSAPHLIKGPVEMLTGTSLFQRGIEGGRPLKEMDPLVGRTISNFYEQVGRLTGEKMPASQERSLMKPGVMEQVIANSPYTRWISSARTALDPRKSALGKLFNLASGAKVYDISPRAQEANLREEIRKLQSEAGAVPFEVMGFPAKQLEYWRVHDPARYQEAKQLQILAAERSKIAKLVKQFVLRGVPEGQALVQAQQAIEAKRKRH